MDRLMGGWVGGQSHLYMVWRMGGRVTDGPELMKMKKGRWLDSQVC